jgi:hypothetical protein
MRLRRGFRQNAGSFGFALDGLFDCGLRAALRMTILVRFESPAVFPPRLKPFWSRVFHGTAEAVPLQVPELQVGRMVIQRMA